MIHRLQNIMLLLRQALTQAQLMERDALDNRAVHVLVSLRQALAASEVYEEFIKHER